MRIKPHHAGRQADSMQAEPGKLTEGVPRAHLKSVMATITLVATSPSPPFHKATASARIRRRVWAGQGGRQD